MTRDRTQLIGAAVAYVVLVVLVVLDLAVPADTAVLTSLFGIAPLIACAVVPARGTAMIAVAATVAAVASGWWDDNIGTAQQNVRLVNAFLVAVAAVAIAVVRDHREQRFAQVSAIAEAAQRAILPVLPVEPHQVAVGTRYQSAARGAMVGGDLYDCYHTEVHTRFLIGDVRGKGIQGVEQAARVIRAFRQAAALRETLVEVAQEMTDYLTPFFSEEEFATALLIEVADESELVIVSAGHPPPSVVRRDGDGGVLELPPGLPLGIGVGVAGYEGVALRWQRGDRVLMYTDGLSEAKNAAGEFLALEQLEPRLRQGSVDSALDAVLAAVAAHVPRGRLEDDLAMVLLENVAPA
jgi:sigma-B regulation protein RsbU (phosphoserine phosphatase)